MITEDYCNFDIAKLLKEKGFDYYPDGSYWLIDANNVMYWVSEIGAYDYVDNPTESFQRPKNGYRLVTQAMAMKWLREVHNIYADPIKQGNYNDCSEYYTWIVARMGIIHRNPSVVDELSYKQAIEAALKYSLENLI